ncbi:hypothetical protein PENSUB_13001 [Penicillium subrubescens]|uniref:Uncharacterized protein n=1 Tax=Penicillium subrubescens TaxID=1316194 RepID=A0A1Q5SUD3_9EURO|nr:hypothetical protein PENSUB_13001 [Penicillium subrubescens]
MFRTAPRMAGYVDSNTSQLPSLPRGRARARPKFDSQFLGVLVAIAFVFRENRVPYYQRLFQNHDGKRQWWKTSRSSYIMYPYLISVYGLGAATTYAMCRMVFGKKTWFGDK